MKAYSKMLFRHLCDMKIHLFVSPLVDTMEMFIAPPSDISPVFMITSVIYIHCNYNLSQKNMQQLFVKLATKRLITHRKVEPSLFINDGLIM